MKTTVIFVGGMAAGAGLLYVGVYAYLTVDWWFPRRWTRQRPTEDVDLPDEEWGPYR